MKVDIKFDLVSPCRKSRQPVSVSFPIEKWKILKEFRLESDRLRNTEYIKLGHSANLEFVIKNRYQAKAYSEKVDYDRFVTVLMRLRPFVHQNELTFFHKVKGILFANIDIDIFQDHLKWISNLFELKLMRKQISIEIGDLVVFTFQTFMNYLNAFEYHRDKDKIEVTKSTLGFFMDEQNGTPAIALMASSIIKAIFLLSDTIETLELIKKGDSREFLLPQNYYKIPIKIIKKNNLINRPIESTY